MVQMPTTSVCMSPARFGPTRQSTIGGASPPSRFNTMANQATRAKQNSALLRRNPNYANAAQDPNYAGVLNSSYITPRQIPPRDHLTQYYCHMINLHSPVMLPARCHWTPASPSKPSKRLNRETGTVESRPTNPRVTGRTGGRITFTVSSLTVDGITRTMTLRVAGHGTALVIGTTAEKTPPKPVTIVALIIKENNTESSVKPRDKKNKGEHPLKKTMEAS